MNRNDENDEHSCSGLRLVSEVIPYCIRQILAAGQHYENCPTPTLPREGAGE